MIVQKPNPTALTRIFVVLLASGAIAGCDFASKLPDAPQNLGVNLPAQKPPTVTGIEPPKVLADNSGTTGVQTKGLSLPPKAPSLQAPAQRQLNVPAPNVSVPNVSVAQVTAPAIAEPRVGLTVTQPTFGGGATALPRVGIGRSGVGRSGVGLGRTTAALPTFPEAGFARGRPQCSKCPECSKRPERSECPKCSKCPKCNGKCRGTSLRRNERWCASTKFSGPKFAGSKRSGAELSDGRRVGRWKQL